MREQILKKETSQPDAAHRFFGRHLVADYRNCESDLILDGQRCIETLRTAVGASGARILSERLHTFENGAVTAVLLLAESHATIHTYPEHKACFVDFFTCGSCDLDAFLKVLKESFCPTSELVRVIERGEQAT